MMPLHHVNFNAGTPAAYPRGLGEGDASQKTRFLARCLARCQATASDNAIAAERVVNCAPQCSKLDREYAARDAALARLKDLAKQEAALAAERMGAVQTMQHQRRACQAVPPLLTPRGKGGAGRALYGKEAVRFADRKRWRYFSLLDVGSSNETRLCLLFKEGIQGNRVYHACSEDGLSFTVVRGRNAKGKGRWEPLFQGMVFGEKNVNERQIAHNFAAVRLEEDMQASYAIVGGQDVFSRAVNDSSLPAGIRFTRGRGWPWRAGNWSYPAVALRSGQPHGCIDRRPSLWSLAKPHGRRGQPSRCEFDGRLSIVHHRGAYRIFARSNLFENAITGGRFVQTTSSSDGQTWTPWQQLRIRMLPPGSADLYFFAAQRNPVNASTLMAIFPISQPPDACIAIAFSMNGVEWSAPYALQLSVLGWRTSQVDLSGGIEWRNEDHPVAGGAHLHGNRVWFYIHHSVSGMSMRDEQRPQVIRYTIPSSALRRVSEQQLQRLSMPKGSAKRSASGGRVVDGSWEVTHMKATGDRMRI